MSRAKKKLNRKKSKFRYSTYDSKLAERRIELGLSQQEVSEFIGLERTSITNIEAGRQDIHIRDIRKWAELYKWSVQKLLKAAGI